MLALVPEVCDLLKQLPRQGELVFHTQDGQPWRSNVQKGFGRIVKQAGIKRCPEALRAAQVQLPYVDVLKDVSDTYHEPLKLAKRKSA